MADVTKEELEQAVFDYLSDNMHLGVYVSKESDPTYGKTGNVEVEVELWLRNPATGERERICQSSGRG